MPSAIRDSEQSRTQITGGARIAVTPPPDVARWAIWQVASPGFAAGNFRVTVGDLITTGDSGATDTDIPADIGTGTAHAVTYQLNAGRLYSGMPWIFPGRRTVLEGTLQYDNNNPITDGRYFIGASSTPAGFADPTLGDFVGTGFIKVTNQLGNWQLITSLAGVVSLVDTNVAIVLRQRYKWKIILNQGVVSLSIDNGLTVHSSASFPVADLGLVWYVKDNNFGGTQAAWFEYQYAENATP